MNDFNPPFLYQMFNIFYFFSSQLISGRNALLHNFNAFAEGLNRRTYLPKYVLVLLNQDILKMVDYDLPGLTKQPAHCVNWLATQLNREIESKKEKMFKKRHGSLHKSDVEPMLIWVELFDQPYTRNQFNKAINEMAVREKNCRVLRIESLGICHFDTMGRLNFIRKQQLWHEINYHMEQFYKSKTDLNPRYYIQNPLHHRNPDDRATGRTRTNDSHPTDDRADQ